MPSGAVADRRRRIAGASCLVAKHRRNVRVGPVRQDGDRARERKQASEVQQPDQWNRPIEGISFGTQQDVQDPRADSRQWSAALLDEFPVFFPVIAASAQSAAVVWLNNTELMGTTKSLTGSVFFPF